MKKIISFMLMVMMALSLCSCGLGGNIEELTLEQSGKRIRDYESLLSWSEDFADDYERWAESGEVRKGQWYAISGKESYEYSNQDGNGQSTTKISGKYYYSPYAYEQKLSLKITTSGSGYYEGERVEYTETVKIIYVEGAWYVKTETKQTTDDGKSSAVDYSSSSQNEYTALLSVISSPLAILDAIVVDFEDGRLYVSDELIEWTESYSSSTGDYGSTSTKDQGIIEFEKESIFVKSVQTYNYRRSEYSGYDYDGSYYYSSSTSESTLTVKKSFFGSVSRPNDYYKYEGEVDYE